VKNGLVHETPLPRSVLTQLRPRCAELLGSRSARPERSPLVPLSVRRVGPAWIAGGSQVGTRGCRRD
jgi:hypothetical protein